MGPNNPYQDRPLPYVIGSEKWKNSSKIGLESSSSSESEQVDEEESDSEADDTAAFRNLNLDPKSNLVGLLPSLNETYNKRNDITYMDNDKMDVVSQNNIDSISESVTPNNSVPKVCTTCLTSILLFHIVHCNATKKSYYFFRYHYQMIQHQTLQKN